MAPFKTIQIRKRYNPWMSQETLNLIEERNRLHKNACESRSEEDWVIYKRFINNVNKTIKYENKNKISIV